MNIVIDTNILISALIKNSIVRKIIFESGWTFYYPLVSLEEIEKYRFLILEKSGLSTDDYKQLFGILQKYLSFVNVFTYESYLVQAQDCIKHIDEKDVVFVALALSLKNDGIWTEDRDFERQDRVKVWKTVDILKQFNIEQLNLN